MTTPAYGLPVLVVGEALVDVVTTAGGAPQEHVGGSPANVALGLGRLGVPVRFRTAVGADTRGRRIASHLAGSGVEVDPASFSLERTSTAIATIGHNQSAHYQFDVDWRLTGPLTLGQERIVHVGSIGCYLEPGATAVREFVQAISGQALVSFDPNIRSALLSNRGAARRVTEEVASRSHLVKLSDEDADWLYPGAEVDSVLRTFLRLGARVVAVTCGARGAVLASREAQINIKARSVTVQDTVGAGDSFMAALVSRLATGLLGTAESLQAAGEFAALTASVTVGRRGADLPTRADVDDQGDRLGARI